MQEKYRKDHNRGLQIIWKFRLKESGVLLSVSY
jgi:hypothetical protein